MKKFEKLFWLLIVLGRLAGYMLFALVVAMSLGLPNTILSGIFSCGVVVAGLLFSSNEDIEGAIRTVLGK